MKKLILVLLHSFLLTACSHNEQNPAAINKALNYETSKNAAVIYILRDFYSSTPISLEFTIIKIIDPDSRNKLDDAMNSLDGYSLKGAGIPYNIYSFHHESFARVEMPPGQYNMYAYFILASHSEIVLSRKTRDFEAGKIYFFKISPEEKGPFSSTVYYLREISPDKAKKTIKEHHLEFLKYHPAF